MKKIKVTLLIFFFLASAMSIPVVSVLAQSGTSQLRTSAIKAEDNSTMIAAASSSVFNWWGPTTYIFSSGDLMRETCIETLFRDRGQASKNTLDDYVPVLATSYNIVEEWPEEENTLGWINTGGIHTLDVVLRENVLFHDGSEFNATVVKWNFDRSMTLTGNLTGGLIWTQWKHEYYRPARDMRYFFTDSWNYSYLYSNDPVNGEPVTPDYYGKDNDPNLSWTTVDKTYTVDGWYPIINKTLIVKSADETASGTGGTIRFEFNDWQTGVNYISLTEILSMETYGGYFGYQLWDAYDGVDVSGYPMLVGTGSYKAVEVDKVDKHQMVMERFDDYWNFTALRADGKMVVKDAIWQYYTGAQTQQEKTTAIIAGDVDFTDDGAYSPIYPDQIEAESSLDYFDDGIANSIEQIIFVWPNTDTALRKAICYAFDYDNFITVGHEGRAERTYNPLGQNSVWYDASITGADRDLTIARQTLLDDPTYGALLAAEGITASSTTTDWHDFADDVAAGTLDATTTAAFTLNWYHDLYSEDITNVLQTSIEDIGMVFNITNPTGDNPYGEWKITGAESVFDMLIANNPWPYANGMEAFDIDWPVPVLEIGYWDAFYTTASQYRAGTWYDDPETWNYGHTDDLENSILTHGLYCQNDADRQDSYDTIVKWHSQEEFTNLYISQNEIGYAVSKKYAVDWYWGSSVNFFARVSIGPGIPEAGVPIPGFSTGILVFISILSVLAISYTIMKKKK